MHRDKDTNLDNKLTVNFDASAVLPKHKDGKWHAVEIPLPYSVLKEGENTIIQCGIEGAIMTISCSGT